METIRSTTNPWIRRIRAVSAGRERGVCLLEGDRLVDEALRQGRQLECLVVADDRSERVDALRELGQRPRLVSRSIAAAISQLKSSPGVLALTEEPEAQELARLELGPEALVVVAGGIQDPGNLGALARTSEAAGARVLCVSPGGCSPWNPKALRGSMGSLLRLPVLFYDEAEDLAQELAQRGVHQLVAATRGGRDPAGLDWPGPVALWLTGETGADATLPGLHAVTIPLANGVESLNVTAAAAVLLFQLAALRRNAR